MLKKVYSLLLLVTMIVLIPIGGNAEMTKATSEACDYLHCRNICGLIGNYECRKYTCTDWRGFEKTLMCRSYEDLFRGGKIIGTIKGE